MLMIMPWGFHVVAVCLLGVWLGACGLCLVVLSLGHGKCDAGEPSFTHEVRRCNHELEIPSVGTRDFFFWGPGPEYCNDVGDMCF